MNISNIPQISFNDNTFSIESKESLYGSLFQNDSDISKEDNAILDKSIFSLIKEINRKVVSKTMQAIILLEEE